MATQPKNYNFEVHASEIKVALKFYQGVLGLKINKSSKREVLLSGANYNSTIKKKK